MYIYIILRPDVVYDIQRFDSCRHMLFVDENGENVF